MIRINLLPHRELKRQSRQRQFFTLLGLSAIAAVGVVILGYLFLAARLDNQTERNEVLRKENASLDQQIAEIEKLKSEKQALLERKKIVERLQNNRTEAVRMLDQLTRQTPDGIYLKSVKDDKGVLVVVGLTQSNARVSGFMQNLSDSPLFEQPILVEVKAAAAPLAHLSEFTLHTKITKPDIQVASAVAAVAPGQGAAK